MVRDRSRDSHFKKGTFPLTSWEYLGRPRFVKVQEIKFIRNTVFELRRMTAPDFQIVETVARNGGRGKKVGSVFLTSCSLFFAPLSII